MEQSQAVNLERDSVFSRRRRIYEFIRNGYLGPAIINELLPSGCPHLYEKQMWDYKLELPILPTQRSPTEVEKTHHASQIAELVKDAVSFYNSFGGYLVAGIRDQPRETIGFDKYFDVGDFNKRLQGATRHNIDCHFALLSCQLGSGEVKVGVLFIPQRPDGKEPAQFLRNAPPSATGKSAYKNYDIYFRQGDECRPALIADDYSFLCSQGRRNIGSPSNVEMTSVFLSNLGVPDPGFIRFVGREDHLQKLWRWLCDKFAPCKLLAGAGGVGKTTIAREFAQEITRGAPFGFEAVIWLTAKNMLYVPLQGTYKRATRVDFTNVETLLQALLLEMGSTEEMLDPNWTRSELIEEVIKTLCVIPAFVVIDDVDSLPADQQHAVFHTILQIMTQTVGRARVASRAMLTARLDLGADDSQLMRVTGLELKDFAEYVEMTAQNMGLPWNLKADSKLMKRFRQSTDGSPTFAASILRLLRTGETLESALREWQGAKGEEVREFAFKKELKGLTDSQARTLYAACVLGETSLVELQNITGTSKSRLTDDLGELRKYHFLALEDDLPGGGAKLIVPNGIRLMINLVKSRVHDPKHIDRSCVVARKAAPKVGDEVGTYVHRVVALWTAGNVDEALEVAKWCNNKIRDNSDLKCLLGRAYLRTIPPDVKAADIAFHRAYELGCARPELISLWTEAKRLLGDWGGIIEISRQADKREPSADNCFYRASAYGELGNSLLSSGNMDGASRQFLQGAQEIDQALIAGHARGRASELVDMRRLLLQSYLATTDRATPDPQEHVRVWLATVDAFKCRYRDAAVFRLGVQRLESWWTAVEKRESFDAKAVRLLGVQLRVLDMMLGYLKRVEPLDAQLAIDLQSARDNLHERVAVYDALADGSVL